MGSSCVMELIIKVVFCLALAVFMRWNYAAEAQLIQRVLNVDDHPNAICNDGTPAVYYHTDSDQGGQANFVIFLEGGSFCDTPESCEERCQPDPDPQYLCSSSGLDSSIDPRGILSSDVTLNPYFAHYYKVFVHYCSSDMFIGDREASNETAGYYFRGATHVTAVIQSLQTHTSLSSARTVIFTGTSAGGRGAAFNCDIVANLLPDVDVKCVVDATMFYPDFGVVNPFDPTCLPFNDLIYNANLFWNGHVENFDINTWWQDFGHPLFIAIFVYDVYGFSYYCVDQTSETQRITWAEGMTELALSLTATAPEVGLFMPACDGHVLITQTRDFHMLCTTPPSDSSYDETLSNWMNDTVGSWKSWDDCSPWVTAETCNPECTAWIGADSRK